MPDGKALDQRVEELARQLQALSQKVDQLEARLEQPLSSHPRIPAPPEVTG